MSFTARDLRAGTDVFSTDNVYLGTVVRVRWQGEGWLGAQRVQTARGAQPVPGAPGAFSGERLGPMPTAEIGNSGPNRQSSATRFGTVSDAPPWAAAPPRPAELLVFCSPLVHGRVSLGPVFRRIPARLIHLVALERIILSVNADALP